MSILIADPFLLSTYTSSKRPAYSEGSPGPSKYTNVYATQEHASTSEAASSYVTVTVQGEGVHVLDVSFDITGLSRKPLRLEHACHLRFS